MVHRNFISMALAVAFVMATAGVSLGGGPVPTQGNPSCITQCRAAHSQCRVHTRGSQSCDAQLQACLQGCLRR